MKYFLTFALFPALMAASDHVVSFEMESVERKFLVHVPESAGLEKRPALVVIHGAYGNATDYKEYLDVDEKSERYGFVAAYADGTASDPEKPSQHRWNFGDALEAAVSVDDVSYFDKIFESLEENFQVDPEKIFLIGISEGGMMTYRLACERANKIAGVAPIAGSLEMKSCRPERPVPLVSFHGTKDKLVPFNGQRRFQSASDSLAEFFPVNGCESGYQEMTYQDLQADGTTVSAKVFSPCRHAPMTLVTIKGGGHTWPGIPVEKGDLFGTPMEPGMKKKLAPWVLGNATLDISATEEAWLFFESTFK